MAVDRSRLPALGPDPAFTFPELRRRTLDNGLRVCTAEHHGVPLVSFLVLLPVGAAADPVERPGLAAVTGDMLDEGCGSLGALDVHDAMGRIGAHLDTEIVADATLLTLTALARHAGRGMALLADMVIRPTIAAADFDRVRQLRLSRLVQLQDMPPALADRAFARLLYPDHPYGHLPIGTEQSLRAMTLDDVRGFHANRYHPAQTTVIAVGDASHDELVALVKRGFGGWSPAAAKASAGPAAARASAGSTAPEPTPPAFASDSADASAGRASFAEPSEGRQVVVVHRPGAAQSELRVGHVAVPRSTPDYHALLVLNMVLGGQFVSRINLNLREDKGYTYGARTMFEFRKGRGPFVFSASVQTDATAAAIREAVLEMSAIRGDRPVTPQELETARAALTRGYPRNFETAEQVSRGAAQLALYGLPDDYFSTFTPTVLAVDEAAVTRVAAAHIDPSRLQTVIVGDRGTFEAGVSALGMGAVTEAAAG